MTLVSNSELYDKIKFFFQQSNQITLYSAYINSEVLKNLNFQNKITQIIVRWEIKDLVNKVSDLELFYYCKEKKIKLYRNTRIHLKAIIDDKNQIIFGSSNYTNKGLATIPNYNFELNSNIEILNSDDLTYLNKILRESEYIDEDKFQIIKNEVEKYKNLTFEINELPTQKSSVDMFLMSQLPMSNNFESLYNYYKHSKFNSIEDQHCFIHDLVLFNIEQADLSFDDFFALLKENFNKHPFVLKLKNFIKSEPRQSLRYGGVVDWINQNTTTVPTPLRWEIKEQEIVNILYYWITNFDSDFTTTVPGRKSEVIFYNKS